MIQENNSNSEIYNFTINCPLGTLNSYNQCILGYVSLNLGSSFVKQVDTLVEYIIPPIIADVCFVHIIQIFWIWFIWSFFLEYSLFEWSEQKQRNLRWSVDALSFVILLSKLVESGEYESLPTLPLAFNGIT